MALKSSNIANTLLQTLSKLTAQGDAITVTKETAKPVQTLVTVCTLLVDSAETVAETTGDPEIRERTFEFATKIRQEIKNLDNVRKQIEINPNEPSIKQRLLQAAKNIAHFTTEIVTVQEDVLLKKVVDLAKKTAQSAKVLISTTEATYEEFFAACKDFGGSSLAFAKLLQEVARKVEDKSHQEKIVSAYNGIKEIGPQMIRIAKRAYENPKNVDTQQELQQISRTLVSKISYAISTAQSDGGKVQNEISRSQPTIPIPAVPLPQEDDVNKQDRRRRTIVEPTAGNEILSRARTATITREIEDEIETASSLRVKRLQGNQPPGQYPPVNQQAIQPKAEEEDEAESLIDGMEQELKRDDPNTGQGKANLDELQRQMEKLRQENYLLFEENQNLNKVIDTMKKRLSIRL